VWLARGAGTAVFLTSLVTSSTAFAQVCDTTVNPALDLPVGTTQKCGIHFYESLKLGGTINVADRNMDAPSSGWLHIKANSIVIDATGVIDASSAGFRGSTEMTPPDSGFGPGGAPPVIFRSPASPGPGGGGALATAGGQGTDSGCGPVVGAEGGLAYASAMDIGDPDMLLGSAGGASRSVVNPNYVGPGGNGGGTIILEAQRIEINGTLRVDGGPGLTTNGATPGGGAAGTTVILADDLVIGSMATIAANGGAGALATDFYGGGGSGGMIVVSATGAVTSQLVAPLATVEGGSSNAACCAATPSACGAPGIIVQTSTMPACIDADDDDAPSRGCGGDDCNDANSTVGPDSQEECDGLDNDCDDQIDEDPAVDTPICSLGTHCLVCDGSDPACIPKCVPDEPSGASTGAGSEDRYVQFGGGLCASGGGRERSLMWLACALGAALLVRRRR
jgi:hypothetical protein